MVASGPGRGLGERLQSANLPVGSSIMPNQTNRLANGYQIPVDEQFRPVP